MKYKFKALTTKKITIDANNILEAKEFYIENYVAMNIDKKDPYYKEV